MILPAQLHWAPLLILVPLIAALLCVIWPARVRWFGLAGVLTVLMAVIGLGVQLLGQDSYSHAPGGWEVPLGIALYADGLSLFMLATTALVACGVSVYATAYFKDEQSRWFWPIWMFLLAGLNALLLSADIFNLYVTLELVGLAAVALTALGGRREALDGAMRYLLATLLGSLCYLLGVALLYHGYGSLDIATLGRQLVATPLVSAAMGLMGVGLLMKTALFPLHFWLPSAHANAPAPVSAVLSALVVKASFYVFLRLWLNIFGPLGGIADLLLGLLGALAIVWGSIQALRQTRLKLLVAYSTVAQIGYLFLAFPLAMFGTLAAWHGALYLALSHALAKAALFLAAGNLLCFGGHDRISDLDRVVQRLPLTAATVALAGVSIMGLPPSGGFIGKWFLLEAALSQGRWDLLIVMLLGGLLAAAYIFKVLGHMFTQATVTHEASAVPATMEWAALLLACGAVLLGFLAVPILQLLGLGDPLVMTEVMR